LLGPIAPLTRVGNAGAMSNVKPKPPLRGPVVMPPSAEASKPGVPDDKRKLGAQSSASEPKPTHDGFEANLPLTRDVVLTDAKQVLANVEAKGNVEAELSAIDQQMGNGIQVVSQQLAASQKKLNQKEAGESWFQRHIWDPPDVRELKAEVKSEQGRLRDLKAIKAAADIVLAMGIHERTLSPDEWSQLTKQAQAGVSSSRSAGQEEWVKAVSALAVEQGKLEVAAGVARHAESVAQESKQDFGATVPFWEKNKILDFLTFGQSTEGRLFRAASTQLGVGSDVVATLQSLAHQGSDQLNEEISRLLKTESPGYLTLRAEYDRLKPAFQGVEHALEQTQGALSALGSAQAAITARNVINSTQPPATTIEFDVTTQSTKEVPNVAHSVWTAQAAAANAAVLVMEAAAEKKVRELNEAVSSLQPALMQAGVTRDLKTTDSDLNWFLGRALQVGAWSYDLSRANEMGEQLGKLKGNLESIRAGLAPTYQQRSDAVWQAISQRRQELVNPAGR
jgi:hypothetical protein